MSDSLNELRLWCNSIHDGFAVYSRRSQFMMCKHQFMAKPIHFHLKICFK